MRNIHGILCPFVCYVLILSFIGLSRASAQDQRPNPEGRLLTGFVQNQDLRRVPQAVVQVRDQEGNTVVQTVTDDAGEFSVTIPQEGTVSVSGMDEAYIGLVGGDAEPLRKALAAYMAKNVPQAASASCGPTSRAVL